MGQKISSYFLYEINQSDISDLHIIETDLYNVQLNSCTKPKVKEIHLSGNNNLNCSTLFTDCDLEIYGQCSNRPIDRQPPLDIVKIEDHLFYITVGCFMFGTFLTLTIALTIRQWYKVTHRISIPVTAL